MKRITLDEAVPSMVLAATVKDKQGNIVFHKGVALTERHLTILGNRDIRKIIVEGDRSEKETKRLEKLLGAIDKRFSTAGPSEIAVQIKLLIKELIT